MILKNPAVLRKFRVMDSDEERYVRPPREYQIPPFHENMRYCTSNEKYLRPTRWCNPCEKTVVALANELGAYELSDYDFADTAFWFVKTKMVAEMCPLDGAGATLRRGTGTCLHLINAFVALCRAAGIKARYKTFRMKLPEAYMSLAADQELLGMYNMGLPEGEGEVYIDGKWVVANVALRPEVFAMTSLPITKFGEDSIGLTLELIPGTIKRFESIPMIFGIAMKAAMWLVPAAMERTNIAFQKRLPLGRKIIKEAGGIEAFDRKARRMRKLFSPEELLNAQALKHYDKIIVKRK